MNFDWSSLILGAGLLNILLVLGFVLLSKRRQWSKSEKLWLSVVTLSIAIILFEGIIRGSLLFRNYPHLLFISTPVYFIVQPALLFYLTAAQQLKIRYWPHLVLPLVNMLIMARTFSMSAEDKLIMFEAEGARDPVWIVAIYLSYFGYYQYRLFKSHLNFTKSLEAEFSRNDLEWSRLSGNITAAAGLAIFAIPVSILIQYLGLPEDISVLISKSTNVAFSVISHVLLFAILITPEIPRPMVSDKSKPTDHEDIEASTETLLKFLNEGKSFLNNQLSLNLLAKELGWSRSQLSMIINRGFQQNFYDLINGFRLQEFEQQIKAGKHKSYSLDHLVQSCGFTNYVTFYRFVKRTKHISPSAFIKHLESPQ